VTIPAEAGTTVGSGGGGESTATSGTGGGANTGSGAGSGAAAGTIAGLGIVLGTGSEEATEMGGEAPPAGTTTPVPAGPSALHTWHCSNARCTSEISTGLASCRATSSDNHVGSSVGICSGYGPFCINFN